MTRSLIPNILIPSVALAVLGLALIGRAFSQPTQVVILHDGVAVTYCGAREVYDGTRWTFVWPCVIFRDSFSSRELPPK